MAYSELYYIYILHPKNIPRHYAANGRSPRPHNNTGTAILISSHGYSCDRISCLNDTVACDPLLQLLLDKVGIQGRYSIASGKIYGNSRWMLTPIQSRCTASELPVKFRSDVNSLTPFRWLETLRNHMTTMATAVPGYWNAPQKIGFCQGWGSVYMNAYHTNEGTQIILVILDGHTLSFVPSVFTNMNIMEFPICKSI